VDSLEDLRDFRIARQREIILSSDTKEFNIEKEKKEGLGRLPNVTSASSLILFNSNVNLYNSYVIMNNFVESYSNANITKQETSKKLGEAPKTVSEGDVLPEIAGLNYNYEPVLGDVPQFNLPNQLPNLPGVANISWTAPDLPEWSAVVPSNKRMTVANLPPIDISAASSSSAPLPNIANPPPPPGMDGAPPPPPPPPVKGVGPPPPPTQPNEGPPLPESTTENDTKDSGEKSAADGGDSHNMLLEQIRNPGMKLKSAKAERKAEDVPAERRAPRSTADLFGDLLNALKIRRQGMQGNNEAKAKPEESAAPVQSDVLPKREDADWED